MQALKASSHVNKKFLQSIENSYSEEFYSALENASHKYAQLNITESASCFIKMSTFLMNQLSLFELNAKIQVSSTSIKISTTKTKKQIIRLKTNKTNEANKVKESFLKFIDQQTECLCPVILTNQMICQFDQFKCLISLNEGQDFIEINSNTLLNDLLTIQIELVEQAVEFSLATSLKVKKFDLKIILDQCKWFQSNLNVIRSHLDEQKRMHFKRNLVLTGLKGSGKTIICKYICNLISNDSLYHYINCQQFMNKTPETIYEQLKLVYSECLWYQNIGSGGGECTPPCLVVLDNLDLLIENKSHTIDPSAMLYHAQIVEVIKEILARLVWNNKSANICTIVTISSPFNEMPALFHCKYSNNLKFTYLHNFKLSSE